MIRLLMIFAALQMPVHFVSDAHLVIYHPDEVGAAAARTYLSVLNAMYTGDAAKFGLERAPRLTVRLCRNGEEFSALTGADSMSSPLWKDGTLYVTARMNPDERAFRSALEAGVIQGILEPIRQNGAPRWLIHAAAAYESGEYTECTAPPVESVKYFSDLNEKIQDASSPDELTDLCFYLGATGKFFDLKYGVGSFVKLVREFRKETTFESAVRRLFNVKESELEREWREFISEKINGR